MTEMSQERQEYLSIKHTNRLPGKSDKWLHFGAGASGTCPHDGLPNWRWLPLDKKIPFVPMPNKAKWLSCGRLGQTPWQQRRAHDLRLLDAYGHTTLIPYNSLRDPHLRQHHSKPTVRRRLEDHGHVTGNNSAVCHLKMINRYREIRRLNNLDEVHHNIRKEEEADQEERRLRQIEDQLQRVKNKMDVEALKEHVAKHKDKMKQLEAEELKRKANAKKRKDQYITAMKELKEEEIQAKALEKVQRAEETLKRHLEHVEMEKEKVLMLTGKLTQRQQYCQQYLKQKEADRQEKALQQVKSWWEKKKTAIIQEEQARQTVIADLLATRQAKIERRKEKAMKMKELQNDPAFLHRPLPPRPVVPDKKKKRKESPYVFWYRIMIASESKQ